MGVIAQWPASASRICANTDGLSKRGKHSHAMQPSLSTSAAEFGFKSEGNQTAVTWSMVGKKTLVTKAIFLFVNMDNELGGAFEKGLAQMKSVAETVSKQ